MSFLSAEKTLSSNQHGLGCYTYAQVISSWPGWEAVAPVAVLTGLLQLAPPQQEGPAGLWQPLQWRVEKPGQWEGVALWLPLSQPLTGLTAAP